MLQAAAVPYDSPNSAVRTGSNLTDHSWDESSYGFDIKSALPAQAVCGWLKAEHSIIRAVASTC